MKSTQTSARRTDARRAEEEVRTRINGVFRRCPELTGFWIRDRNPVHDGDEQGDVVVQLVVSDMGLSAPLAPEEIDKLYNLIGAVICDLLSEREDAAEWLRGRTFARALH